MENPLILNEDFLSLVYRYYEFKGYKNIILIKINNLITTLFLLFVIVFVTSFIDYPALLADNTGLETVVSFSRPIHPAIIVYMVFFLSYWCWNLLKTIYDLKKLNDVRYFYQYVIKIDDFKLKNTNWSTVNDLIAGCTDTNQTDIIQIILQKEKSVLNMINFILSYHNSIPLSKIFEWELGFLLTNYILERKIDANGLRKRFKIIGIINLFIIPLLLAFSGVYIVFHYGEIIYTNSLYLTSREWSKWLRYTKIRRLPNELPHEFEDRLFRAKKYADKYYSFFRPSMIYNFAQLLLINLSIILAVFILFIVLNFNYLVKFEGTF